VVGYLTTILLEIYSASALKNYINRQLTKMRASITISCRVHRCDAMS